MEQFKYKTRGKSLPQGKPRIYFCSHPEDTDLYLNEISEEILERQNCTIWYRDSLIDGNDEEIFASLSQMQLFVIPITLKFLTTSNRALDVEFPYAVKNHIPVLPLMQEAGLEELFNQKCGELQFLDKFNQDRTAISYSNKLDKYLSDVLIGDLLAEQVRAAFAAYIFLSYRKKDRIYAQKLMDLIHENDFCRDIAIWYDEFLTPGENFNTAIKEALQKSQLFALVVTPNLINEMNYVQKIEYPMAKSENKHVLAAQLKATDTKELHEKFQDLPECIDAYDSAALSEELLQMIQKIAIQENKNDPQHNFFIGLAYLGGIDMEVNTAKAFSLIEGAANSGLPQAMEKLVSMYKKAEGVERDYARAAYWQEKLADFYLNQYETTKESKYAYEYIDTLLLLKETLDEIQSTKESEEVCQKAYIFSRKRYEAKQDDENGKHFISCCISLGDICRQEGALIQAGALYQEAYRVCQKMSTEFIQYYMHCLDRLASYNEVTNHLEKALDYSLQSLSLAEKNSDRRQLAECYINFGHINMTAEKYETAKLNYEKALSIVQELCIENPQPDTFHFLVICYRHISSACRYLDENDLAMNYLFDGIQLSDQLIDKSGYLISFQTLSDCHNDLGDIHYDCGNHVEAKKHYLKAQDIIEQLSNKVDTPKVRRAYIQNSKRINAFLQNIPDPAAAIQAGEGGVEAEELLFDLKKHIISSIVAKYSLDGIPFSELLQLGRQALIKGAKKYGRSTGADYEHYVSRALRQEITRAIAMVEREYRISVKDVEDIKKSIKVFFALKEELKRDPSLEEVSNEMNISADHLKELLIIAQKMELEKKEQEKKEEEKEKELGHLDMKYLLQHDEQAKVLLSEQLINLSEREAEVMRLLYGLEGQRVHSIQETSLALGLPQGRIKQIESKVLRKLKL